MNSLRGWYVHFRTVVICLSFPREPRNFRAQRNCLNAYQTLGAAISSRNASNEKAVESRSDRPSTYASRVIAMGGGESLRDVHRQRSLTRDWLDSSYKRDATAETRISATMTLAVSVLFSTGIYVIPVCDTWRRARLGRSGLFPCAICQS